MNTKTIATLVLLLAVPIPSGAETKSQRIGRLLAENRKLRAKIRAQARELHRLRVALAVARRATSQPAHRKGATRPAKGVIPAIQFGQLKEFRFPLKPWQAAPVGPIKVVQVHGPKDMLATIEVRGSQRTIGTPYGRTTALTLSNRRMSIEGLSGGPHYSGVTVWITGMSTAGLADGHTTELNRPLGIIGTKRYRTAIGSTKTVFLLKPIPPEPPPKRIRRRNTARTRR